MFTRLLTFNFSRKTRISKGTPNLFLLFLVNFHSPPTFSQPLCPSPALVLVRMPAPCEVPVGAADLLWLCQWWQTQNLVVVLGDGMLITVHI